MTYRKKLGQNMRSSVQCCRRCKQAGKEFYGVSKKNSQSQGAYIYAKRDHSKKPLQPEKSQVENKRGN